MKRVLRWFVLLTLFAAAAGRADDRFKVIAHSSVPVTSVPARDLSLLFLKKVTTYEKWGNAQKCAPIDLPADSPARAAFTKVVHKKEVGAVKAYWQQQIFSGRATPPAELATDADVIAAVARTAGAIGYVSGGAAVPDGVKVLKVTE